MLFPLTLLLTTTCVAASSAQNAPPALQVAGSQLPLAAEARREHLLGLRDLYRLAIYVEGSPRDLPHLASRTTSKAIRIEVEYEEDIHRPVALDWRNELVPRLEPAAAAHLKGSFAALRRGDVVIVEYAPAGGTVIRVNRATVTTAAHHDIMVAFLDHWLGQRPVSEEMKRVLLESP